MHGAETIGIMPHASGGQQFSHNASQLALSCFSMSCLSQVTEAQSRMRPPSYYTWVSFIAGTCWMRASHGQVRSAQESLLHRHYALMLYVACPGF